MGAMGERRSGQIWGYQILLKLKALLYIEAVPKGTAFIFMYGENTSVKGK